MAGVMEALPASTVRLLGSTQVITSVFSVVKELFENSLDAGATSVEVKLENYGLEKIEVRDNGSGIRAEDIPVFAKRHYTSKIKCHADLESLTTYGFRGEALASLCSVSEVFVTTKTAAQDVGYTYSLSDQGDVKSTTPSPLPQGTTVCAKNLFKNLPVRKQYHNMAKKKKEDFKNVENLLMAYGIILPALRITLRHNKELVWQKVSLQDSAVVMHSIHGKAVMGQMEWKRGEFQDPEMKIELCVPKPGSDVATMSRSTPDKSVHCVNGRPVIVKEIDKLVRQYYSNCHACDMSRHPVYFVRIELPAGDVDVNLEPNKTTVMTTNMTSLRERIEEMLLYLYGPLDQAPSWRYRDADDGGSSSKPEDQQPSNSELIQFQKNHDKLEVKSNSSANACSMSVPMEKGSASNSVTAPLDNGPHSVAHENAQRRLSESKQTSENMSNGCPLSETSGAENVSALTKTPHADFVCDEPQQRMKTDELSISGNFDLGAEILDELLGSFPSTDSNSEKTVSSSNLAEKMELESTETNIDGNSGSVGQSSKEGTGLQSGPGVTSGESAGSSKGQGDGKNRSCVPEPPQAGPSGWNHGTSIMSGAGTPIQPVQLLAPSPSHFPGKRPLSPSHDQQVQRQTAPAEKRQNISSRRLCPAQSTLYDMINNVAVKRAMSAKEIFFKEKRPKVLEENPQADYEEVTEILAEAWNSLSDQEQAVFREKCWQDTQRYNKEAATAKNVAGKVKASAKTRPQVSARDRVAATSTQPTPKTLGKKKAVTYSSQCMVPFSMADLRSCLNHGTPSSQIHFQCPRVLAYLPSCKAWVCGRGAALDVLNLHRLSETMLYHRLLHQHKLVTHLCQPVRLLPSNLGSCWPVFEKLAESCLSLDPFSEISDSCIVANGFQVKCWKDGDGCLCGELVGVCSDVPTYGLPDLCEVLELISASDGSSLAQTRPLKVDNYLRGEAVRMSRQQTGDKSLEDVQDLLEQSASVLPPGCTTCLHDRPFFHPLLADLDAAR